MSGFPVRRINYPDAWTAYPSFMPAVTSGSVYSNNQVIYPFDVAYLEPKSRATGDFEATRPRLGKPRYCAYSCDRPYQVDLIKSIANVNQARYN
jgi:hypothetical protein